MVTVLMPLPAADFDPTEAAVTWQVLAAAGHHVVFATPSGQRSRADDLMLTGQGLDPWGFVPGLRRLTAVGRVLRADGGARTAYAALLEDAAFAAPLHWGAARRSAYDALVLPGGHRAQGMRPYLESPEVQQMTIDAFRSDKPVGAICHGVLVAARAAIRSRRARCSTAGGPPHLTWALEAQGMGHRPLHAVLGLQLLPDLRRGAGAALGVHVGAAGGARGRWPIPPTSPTSRRARRTGGTEGQRSARDSLDDQRPAFVVRDGSYVSARWPGDAHTFARTFATVLAERD